MGTAHLPDIKVTAGISKGKLKYETYSCKRKYALLESTSAAPSENFYSLNMLGNVQKKIKVHVQRLRQCLKRG